MYILRITGILFVVLFISIATVILSIFNYKGKIVYILYKIFGNLILLISGIKVITEGEENLPTKESYLYISNHQSYMDIPILMKALPGNIRFVYKKSINKIPLFGWAMYLAGYIPIDRSDVRDAIKSLKKASKLLKKGLSLVIFPEGTRSSDGAIHEFKKGLTIIAEEAKCNLVPVTIKGSYEILPRGTSKIKSGTVKVKIDRPIEFSKDKMLIKKIQEIIIKNFNEIVI
ncbi:MAG: 1-acyl-sn-glycerol-3-phosphate acyltransferase [Ignavibacteria bacterium]|nr:1-acyl-sn-glycerol-3-phosphate acyltransferase [Ignavibacteria bacterium]